MTLRESFGGDVQRIHDRVDALLDREDAVLVLYDGARLVTYAEGFGVSASQLELLGVEVERALRNVVGRKASNSGEKRRNRESNQGARHADSVGVDDRGRNGGVLRLASKVA
jgi:hypothetical protein